MQNMKSYDCHCVHEKETAIFFYRTFQQHQTGNWLKANNNQTTTDWCLFTWYLFDLLKPKVLYLRRTVDTKMIFVSIDFDTDKTSEKGEEIFI